MGNGKEFFIGFDLGGTKMIASIFDSAFSVLGTEKRKTPSHGGSKAVTQEIAETVKAACSAAGVKVSESSGLGIAVPGPIDRAKGLILDTPNMGFSNYPIGGELERLLALPVVLANDVQSGVRGECAKGALKGYRNAVGIFIGTGIGGGIIIDGKLFSGSSGTAGEIGHMILLEGGPLCGCGRYGCFEALASRTAMAKDAIALASAGKAPKTFETAGFDFRKYKSSVFEAALETGEATVVKAVDRSAYWTGIACANLVNILNPEAILLGGGIMARIGKRYRETALASMDAHLMPALARSVKIVITELGDQAVTTGAAVISAEGN